MGDNPSYRRASFSLRNLLQKPCEEPLQICARLLHTICTLEERITPVKRSTNTGKTASMERKLQGDKALEWSAIVANNSMNRERVAVGVNSYEKSIKIDPIKYLNNCLHEQDYAPRWTDLCCGTGNALIQAAQHFEATNSDKRPLLIGIDLVGYFSPHEASELLDLKQMSLANWQPKDKSDLITCVHGLHYIGDKIELILRAVSCTKTNGLFIGNLDLGNIKIEGTKEPVKILREFLHKNGLEYNARRKLISAQGASLKKSPFRYLGADDKSGPNYTGQPVVDSYYELL